MYHIHVYRIIILTTIFLSNTLSAQIKGVIISDKGGLSDYSGFVVYIKEGNTFPKVNIKKSSIEIGQINKKFSPIVTAINKNSTVYFKNYDDIFHNVFSLTPGNKFDLGVYKGSESYTDKLSKKVNKNAKKPIVKFKNPGKVKVFCNIHEDMMSTIYVFDHGYYANVKKDGQFTLPSPKKGEITIVLDGDRLRKPIGKRFRIGKIPKFLKIKFKSIEMKPTEHHLRKNGNKYENNNWDLDEDDFY